MHQTSRGRRTLLVVSCVWPRARTRLNLRCVAQQVLSEHWHLAPPSSGTHVCSRTCKPTRVAPKRRAASPASRRGLLARLLKRKRAGVSTAASLCFRADALSLLEGMPLGDGRAGMAAQQAGLVPAASQTRRTAAGREAEKKIGFLLGLCRCCSACNTPWKTLGTSLLSTWTPTAP